MSKKRSTPLDNPPSASSDESETDDDDDDDDDDDVEQQQEIITQKAIQQSSGSEDLESESDSEEEEEEEEEIPTPVKKPQTQNPNLKPSKSSSSSESDSESESEPKENHKTKTLTVTPTKSSSIFEFESEIASPSASDFAIKPSKKISAFETPEKKPAVKRHALTSDVKDKKKAKISNGDTEDGKKSAIKRVWSDEDEIMLLQGFLDYQRDNGCSPLSDLDGFYGYSMDSIPGNATKSQLYEKIRRLKKKFRVNSAKVGANGEDPAFVKPHEGKMFKLMKKIWGVDGCETVGNVGGLTARSKVNQSKVKALKVKVAKVKPKMEVEMDDVADDVHDDVVDDQKVGKVEDFETLYPYWYAGLKSEVSTSLGFPAGVVELVKESFNVIGEDKAKEMNEKWKVLFEVEAVLRKKRITIMCDVVRPLL